MTIILPELCEKCGAEVVIKGGLLSYTTCWQCTIDEWLVRQRVYAGSQARPLIYSRAQAEKIKSWSQEYPSTPESALETHDQRKSRLKKEHSDAMNRALGRQRSWE